jgi:hypothetical protein
MAWSENAQPVAQPLKYGVPCVAICVPHFGSVSMDWVESTWGPLRYIPQADFAKTPRLSRGILNIDSHRNELVRVALEDKAVTHVLFLDTDVIAESPKDINQALRMLLQCNAPIASGLYRAKKTNGEYPYAMWSKNPNGVGYLGIDKWTGNWLEVSVIGFGFVLIRREVFETVPPPWFMWKDPTPSEDFYACELFAKYGFKTRVLTDVKLFHAGTLKVRCADAKIVSLEV